MKPRPPAPAASPEIHALRAEWLAGPTDTPERLAAMAALEALTESEENPDAAPGELPPLPDALRTRWEEAYGDSSLPAGDSARQHRRTAPGWARWLEALRTPWLWGPGLAAALLALFLQVSPEPARTSSSAGVVTRSGLPPTPGTDGVRPVYVVRNGLAESAVLDHLRAAFPARSITAVNTRGEVPAGAVNVLELTPELAGRPAAAVSAVETMDETAALESP